ncbi:MerR family transcriptional regulator [Streptomyces gibsoniae]|uniref:MerR family transcriptional regulator n=1 Tax=Streptomyces gibsoniae TaxID=3075529 RepID=A0ABU2TMF8_9ACTN|nr:MerR family transcriptional regulator [Streptomyces sp. DSM 41699]MDT0462123.1 MerR family transcriptional regulator [Streptomyces sp. DSM 41699]
MLIGQLARVTGTSERLIRYYESVGLLTSSRRPNGYRDYDDDTVHTVRQIRALLAAGLSTGLIRQVLPCALADGALRPCPGVLDKLRAQLAHLDHRADELAQARQTLQRAIAVTEQAEEPRRARRHQLR